jgi:hypothetical protein
MERRQRDQLGEHLHHIGVDPHGLGEFGAAVDDTMAECDDTAAGQKLAPQLHDLCGGGMVNETAGPTSFRHYGARSIHGLELRYEPNVLDLAAKEQRAVMSDFVEREFYARGTGVKDSEAAGHGDAQAMILAPPSTLTVPPVANTRTSLRIIPSLLDLS